MTDEGAPGHALFADVLIDSIPMAEQRAYTYRIPPEFTDEVRPGVAVVIPFGSRQRVRGFVVARHDRAPEGNARPITSVVPDATVPEHMVALFEWISRYYMCAFGQVWLTASCPPASAMS